MVWCQLRNIQRAGLTEGPENSLENLMISELKGEERRLKDVTLRSGKVPSGTAHADDRDRQHNPRARGAGSTQNMARTPVS